MKQVKTASRFFPSRRDKKAKGSASDFLGGIFLTVFVSAAVFVTGTALVSAARSISEEAERQQSERTERDFSAGFRQGLFLGND